MRTRFNRKHHTVRKPIPRSGDFNQIRESWIQESFTIATPQHRRVREVSVQKRGAFFVASVAANNNVARGISRDPREAIARCRLLGRTI
jgi:hypothetical protein